MAGAEGVVSEDLATITPTLCSLAEVQPLASEPFDQGCTSNRLPVLSERNQQMLAFMSRHRGEKLAPAGIGNETCSDLAPRSRQAAVSLFLRQLATLPGYAEYLHAEGATRTRRYWFDEQMPEYVIEPSHEPADQATPQISESVSNNTEPSTSVACAGQDPKGELFFPEKPGNLTKSVGALCMRCTTIDECLQRALRFEKQRPEKLRYGIWGGLTPPQRVAIKHEGGEILAESWPAITDARAQNAAGETAWPAKRGPRKAQPAKLAEATSVSTIHEDFDDRVAQEADDRIATPEATAS